MRFVLLSLGFMAWAFYELSGGSDFDPSAVRAARMQALAEEDKATPETPQQTAVTLASAPAVSVDETADSEVSRVSLNLTSLQSVIDAAEEPAAEAPAAETAETQSVPQNVSVITSSADTPAIIPSLIAPNDGRTSGGAILPGDTDIRTVSGNRVNVRGGPGTDFGVVGRLVRGDEVMVLEDNGTGWVRFETTDGITAGWMADFLLTDS